MYEVAYGDAPGTRARLLASAAWQTQVIDLTQDEATLWRGIRKSYKSLIHRGERQYTIASLPSGCIYSAMLLHQREAGRLTRPVETWALMGQWTEQGHGLVVMAGTPRMVDVTTYSDPWPRFADVGLVDEVAFAYFIIWEQWAYYGYAATLRPNVQHALIWTAMKALKARGVQQLEMGWQGQATDPKGQQIEFFRRGFGGHAQEVGTQWPTTSANTTSANT